VLQSQKDYCTSPEREEEFEQVIFRLTGINMHDELKAIEEGRCNAVPADDVLKMVEQLIQQAPSPEKET
jgi:hypothetical protein